MAQSLAILALLARTLFAPSPALLDLAIPNNLWKRKDVPNLRPHLPSVHPGRDLCMQEAEAGGWLFLQPISGTRVKWSLPLSM